MDSYPRKEYGTRGEPYRSIPHSSSASQDEEPDPPCVEDSALMSGWVVTACVIGWAVIALWVIANLYMTGEYILNSLL